jgi:hypothetical protein
MIKLELTQEELNLILVLVRADINRTFLRPIPVLKLDQLREEHYRQLLRDLQTKITTSSEGGP